MSQSVYFMVVCTIDYQKGLTLWEQIWRRLKLTIMLCMMSWHRILIMDINLIIYILLFIDVSISCPRPTSTKRSQRVAGGL